MAKRKQKERKKRQLLRAAQTNDPDVLRRASQKSPELAARTLIGVLSEADCAPSFLAVAEDVCQELRSQGLFGVLGELTEVTQRRSPQLALERALFLFAAGRREEAERWIDGDAALTKLVKPLLSASGEGPVPRVSRSADPELQRVQCFAQAAAYAAQGKRSQALRVVKRLEQLGGHAAHRQALEAVIDYSTRRGVHRLRAARALLSNDLCKVFPELKRRVLTELGESTEWGASALEGLRLTPGDRQFVAERALRSKLAALANASREEAVRWIGEIGWRAFPTEQRGHACLYEAMSNVQRAPERALEMLREAERLGAERVEVLRVRGQVLAELVTKRFQRQANQARQVFLSLAQALQRDPASRPLAAVAYVHAAEFALAIEEGTAAEQDIEHAVQLVPEREQIVLHRFFVRHLASVQSDRLEPVLQRLVARYPESVELWIEYIECARSAEDDDEAKERWKRAAALTNAPELVKVARVLQHGPQHTSPFEGEEPRGSLGVFLDRFLSCLGFYSDSEARELANAAVQFAGRMEAVRARDFLIGVVWALHYGGEEQIAEEVLEQIVSLTPEHVSLPFGATLLLLERDDLLQKWPSTAVAPSALLELSRLFAQAGDSESVGQLLKRHSRQLTREQTKQMLALSGSAKAFGEQYHQVLERAVLTLTDSFAPEVRLERLLEPFDPWEDESSDDEAAGFDMDDVWSLIQQVERMIRSGEKGHGAKWAKELHAAAESGDARAMYRLVKHAMMEGGLHEAPFPPGE